ncbi:phosphatidylinositol class p [Moniliophthora roreri]|nr:phosphatidylinositol class p [Moniliophthora roreri]
MGDGWVGTRERTGRGIRARRRRLTSLVITLAAQLERTAEAKPNDTSVFTPYHASPQTHRSKALELYGFVAWTSTPFLFVIYLLWALLLDEYIVASGVDWYPNRDSRSQFPRTVLVPSENGTGSVSGYISHAREDTAPALYNIPIGLVNRVLCDSEVKRRAE